MWHGTGRHAPEEVLQHEKGIDPRFSMKTTTPGFYGRGLYLAEQARYSNDEKYVHHAARWKPRDAPSWRTTRRAVRQLLVVRAALGKSKEYGSEIDRELTMPPEEEPSMLFDSVRGGPHQPSQSGPGPNDSCMYVLYSPAQAYPEYVVTYTV